MAQNIKDDFSDADFTANPVWSGNTSDFAVITASTLPNGNAITDGYYLASNANTGKVTLTTSSTITDEWRFSLATPNFNPSSTNYFGVILMSSVSITGDINAVSWNGYFLRIGASGDTADYIELYRKSGTTSTKIGKFPSSPNFGIGGLKDGLNIKVIRSPTGVFELFYSTGFLYSSSPTTSAGTLTDNTHTTSSFFGIYSNFSTLSTTRRAYIDNVYLGKIQEPTAQPTNLTFSNVTSKTFTISFTQASPLVDGYIAIRKTGASPTGSPVDGATYSVGDIIGNAVVVYSGSGTTFNESGLTASTNYFYSIFSYNGSIDFINYLTTSPLTGNQTTGPPASSSQSDINPVPSSESSTISSLINDPSPLTSTTGIQVWQITIRDGGGVSDSDNLPTIVTGLTFTQGASNTVTDWSGAILSAGLFDGSNSISIGTITSTKLTFSDFTATASDNSTKTLSIRISLKTLVKDNQIFQFRLDSANVLTDVDGVSSQIKNFTINSDGTKNKINVTATKLFFVQQPTDVKIDTVISPPVTVEAIDINGNRDVDYITNVSIIANGSTLSGSPVSVTPVSGLATFNSLTFTTVSNNVTLTATSGTLTSATSNIFKVIPADAKIGEILINQFSPDYNGSNDEYIEIKNVTGKSFDLSKLKISYQSSGGTTGSAGGTLSGTLEPFSYWLLSPNATITVGQTVNIEKDGNINYGFAATAGQIALVRISDNVKIDGLAYGSITQNNFGEGLPAPAPPTDGGLKRKVDGFDSNDNKNDFTTVPNADINLRNSKSTYSFDLAVFKEDLNFSSQNPKAGTDVTLNIKIKNIGRKDATAFQVSVFDSISGNKQLIETKSFTSLTSNSAVDYQTILKNVKSGNHTILVEISYNSDENNTNNKTYKNLSVSYTNEIIINEIMYSPFTGQPEWVEFFNRSNENINIRDWVYQDPIKKQITVSQNIAGKSFFIIARDSTFLDFYTVNVPVFTASNLSLNNTTDAVVIKDFTGSIIDSVSYNSKWGGGTGISLERINTESMSNDSTNWGSSKDSTGSTPGRINSIAVRNYDITISENDITFFPDIPKAGEDVTLSIKIKNIGRKDVSEFQILILQNNIEIEKKTITGISVNSSLNYSTTLKNLKAGLHKIFISISFNLDENTKNNSVSKNLKVGYLWNEIIINEIMYNPLTTEQPEWIEIYNNSDSDIILSEWKFGKSIISKTVLTQDTIKIEKKNYAIITSDSSITKFFTIKVRIFVLGSKFPSLGNTSDRLKIFDITDAIIDSVNYFSSWGGDKGISLEKINPLLESSVKANWSSCVLPEGATPGLKNSVFVDIKNLPKETISVSPNPFSPDMDGRDDFTVISYKLPVRTTIVRIKIYDVKGRLIKTLLDNEPSGSERAVVWNGLDDSGRTARIGIYIVYLEALSSSKKAIKSLKTTVVLARKL